MAGELYKVVDWVRKNGEVKALDRLRVMVLPVTMEEGIRLAGVGPATACSTKALTAVRKAATTVIGQNCPF